MLHSGLKETPRPRTSPGNIAEKLRLIEKVGRLALSLTPKSNPKSQLRFVLLDGTLELASMTTSLLEYLEDRRLQGYGKQDLLQDCLAGSHPKFLGLPNVVKKILAACQLFLEIHVTLKHGLLKGRRLALCIEIVRLILKIMIRSASWTTKKCYCDPAPRLAKAFNLNFINLAAGLGDKKEDLVMQTDPPAECPSARAVYTCADILYLCRPVIELILLTRKMKQTTDDAGKEVSFTEWSSRNRQHPYWTLWAVPSAMDLLGTLALMAATRMDPATAVAEKVELRRRLPILLLAILRTPMYENTFGRIGGFVSIRAALRYVCQLVGLHFFEREFHFSSVGV